MAQESWNGVRRQAYGSEEFHSTEFFFTEGQSGSAMEALQALTCGVAKFVSLQVPDFSAEMAATLNCDVANAARKQVLQHTMDTRFEAILAD